MQLLSVVAIILHIFCDVAAHGWMPSALRVSMPHICQVFGPPTMADGLCILPSVHITAPVGDRHPGPQSAAERGVA
jgi:hypothetical protein